MSAFARPTVVSTGNNSDAPLVVLLHGRGADERSIFGLVEHLPIGPEYVAVRAPIAEGGGYAWFNNHGIGRPDPGSLRETMNWFRQWIDVYASGRHTVLIGYSGGAAFAGGLVLDDPSRFAGAAILYGTLPFSADLSTAPGRLTGLPMFVAHGTRDTVIPTDLQAATWDYLTGASAAPTIAIRPDSGHDLAAGVLAPLASWLTERLGFLNLRGADHIGLPSRVTWDSFANGTLSSRGGRRPKVSTSIPQEQLTQIAPVEFQKRILDYVSSLDGVRVAQSAISVPGAQGFMLDARHACGPSQSYIVPAVGEFAHQHPAYDGSMHVALPGHLAGDVVAKGWGVAHPLAATRLTPGMTLVFGPRDDVEFDVVVGIVDQSYRFATSDTVPVAR